MERIGLFLLLIMCMSMVACADASALEETLSGDIQVAVSDDVTEDNLEEQATTEIEPESNASKDADAIDDISLKDDDVYMLYGEQIEQLYQDVLIDVTLYGVCHETTRAYLLQKEGIIYLLMATESGLDFGEKIWLFRWEYGRAVEFNGFVNAALVGIKSDGSIEAQEIVDVSASMSWEEYASTSTDFVFQRQFYKISDGELKAVPQTAEERVIETDLHTYVARCFRNDETKELIRWEVEVYNGDALLQTIRYGHDNAHPSWDELIWEEDVNFDGAKDILILQGYYGSHGDKVYRCYCYNEQWSIYWEESTFKEIPNPEVDAGRQLILGSSRGGATSYTDVFYQYDGRDFVLIQTDRYEWDEEKDSYYLTESYKKEDCVTLEHLLTAECLSEEDNKELQRFEAVFDDDTEVKLWDYMFEYTSMTTFHGIPQSYGVSMPGFVFLHEYTLVDMTGDGKKELVMKFGDVGSCVMVVYEENGIYYVSEHSIRQMQTVYEDGMYRGSGGAGTWSYHRISCEDNTLINETVAVHDSYTMYLDNGESEIVFEGHVYGQPVTHEEFLKWEAEHAVNEVDWYYVDME